MAAASRDAAIAQACANVALVKYWGKRDLRLNLPAVGSLSVALGELRATARVERAEAGAAGFVQDGVPVAGLAAERMHAFLAEVARRGGLADPLRADVRANFPVGAGLASSAAIYCAVAAAGASVAGLALSKTELSGLARLGSGSAARSVFGGFVEWARGDRSDGIDSVAHPVLGERDWDVAVAVAVVSEDRKKDASRDAMEHVARSSPLYSGWLGAQAEDLAGARRATLARDLARLGEIAEENCLRMHATCLAARPPIVYFRPTTLAVIEAVQALRREGTQAYFTIDAGPQVKVMCEGKSLERVSAAIASVPGVQRVIPTRPGPGVRMIEGAAPWP